MFASIPSPGSNALSIGGLQLRAYGLMIGLGVMVAIWLTGKRLVAAGIGTGDDATSLGMWGALGGVIGARIYHVITDWQLFRDEPLRAFEIWKGGLGIWGGIALGVAFGLWRARKLGIPLGRGMDAALPSIPLAQAIGRLGNWWNQELFGGPTTLPWALEIDPEFRPARYATDETFHPAFLYEGLWNVGLCLALIWIGKHVRLRPGRLVAFYVAGYTLVRFFIEGIRTDEANEIAGLRVNEWVSIILFAGAMLVIAYEFRRGRKQVAPIDTVVSTESDSVDKAESDDEPDRVEGNTPITE
jgi:prolipoprotein diacylglyceryl transferase